MVKFLRDCLYFTVSHCLVRQLLFLWCSCWHIHCALMEFLTAAWRGICTCAHTRTHTHTQELTSNRKRLCTCSKCCTHQGCLEETPPFFFCPLNTRLSEVLSKAKIKSVSVVAEFSSWTLQNTSLLAHIYSRCNSFISFCLSLFDCIIKHLML